MKKIFLLFLFFMIFQWQCKCDKPALSNEEIIRLTNECHEAGFKSYARRNSFANTDIYEIKCTKEPLYNPGKDLPKGYKEICKDGYKYILDRKGRLTQVFGTFQVVSGLGLPKGEVSLPVKCETNEYNYSLDDYMDSDEKLHSFLRRQYK